MSIERKLEINDTRIAETVLLSLIAREEQKLVFAEEIVPPEAEFIQKLIDHGKKIDDEKFAPNAVFLLSVFVKGGNTNNFFKALNKKNLEENVWIFDPLLVANSSEKDVRDKCKEFINPQSYSTDALPKWKYNCELLVNKYGGDIRNLFDKNESKALASSIEIYYKKRAKINKKIQAHAFLGYGEKLANLAIQWINQYGLYKFPDAKTFGLPVDFQLGRIFIQTNGLVLHGPTSSNIVLSEILLPKLIEIATKYELNLQEVSETLYLIGNNCCNNELHHLCPLEKICDKFIRSGEYQRSGTFSPIDEGRYNKKII